MGTSREFHCHRVLTRFSLKLRSEVSSGMKLLSNNRHRTVALLVTAVGGPGLLLLSRRATTLSPGATTGILRLSSGVVTRGGLATLVMARGVRSTVARNGHLVVVDSNGVVLSVSNRRGGGLAIRRLLRVFRGTDNSGLRGSHVLLDGSGWSGVVWSRAGYPAPRSNVFVYVLGCT